jgi:hypothetical protein
MEDDIVGFGKHIIENLYELLHPWQTQDLKHTVNLHFERKQDQL